MQVEDRGYGQLIFPSLATSSSPQLAGPLLVAKHPDAAEDVVSSAASKMSGQRGVQVEGGKEGEGQGGRLHPTAMTSSERYGIGAFMTPLIGTGAPTLIYLFTCHF